MSIPKIIHQTWKTEKIPGRWKSLVAHNRNLMPDFKYRLWTDEEMMAFVKEHFPVIFPSFEAYAFSIMRSDVFRYLLMDAVGGLYLDLDYELLKPFDVDQAPVVLPKERSIAFGDPYEGIGNAFFASVPNHPFWKDVIADLVAHPPVMRDEFDASAVTGPGLLTRIYYNKPYPDIYVPERILYHPLSAELNNNAKMIRAEGKSLGIHHGWGSWKNRLTWNYLQRKFFRKKWEKKRSSPR
jgi:mannosyltransferase OCH1-like enzyme